MRTNVNPDHKLFKTQRLHRVAQLLFRQQQPYEIWEQLKKEFVNPDTSEPFDLRTVYRDIHELERQWQKESIEDIAKLKAANLAELKEARRLDWKLNNTKGIYQGLKQEADLLGLNAPTKNETNVNLSTANLTDEEINEQLADVARQSGIVGPGAQVPLSDSPPGTESTSG